ncbi:MAG TPA: hypothetical protein PKM25_14400, partial [Candidatus Ozemobacteraceae bacterium]|nr:hypothetical protein [Candidatus Ozemobacteraceae bacterium]
KGIFFFWGLMAANVAITAAWFREYISSGILWMPVMMAWYIPAWIIKLTLFLPSLARRADPLALTPVPTPVLILAAAALFSPEIPVLLRTKLTVAETASSADHARPLALALFSFMIVLWVVRFFQGFVRLEILESMAGTYVRTLLLPTIWLLWVAISSLRAAGREKQV